MLQLYPIKKCDWATFTCTGVIFDEEYLYFDSSNAVAQGWNVSAAA